MNIIDGENVWIVLCSICQVISCTNDPEYAQKRAGEHLEAYGIKHATHCESIAFTVIGRR